MFSEVSSPCHELLVSHPILMKQKIKDIEARYNGRVMAVSSRGFIPNRKGHGGVQLADATLVRQIVACRQ